LRILLVALGIYHAKGGIEKFNQRTLRVLSHLVDSGCIEEVTVISLWDHQKEVEKYFPNLNIKGFSRSKIRTIWAFLLEILGNHYDKILFAHVLLYPLMIISKIFSRKSNIFLFVYGRDVWEKPPWFKGMIVSKLVKKIISISNYTINKMSSVYDIVIEKQNILSTAIDFMETEEAPRFSQDSPVFQILSVSRLSLSSQHKNIDKVITALPQVLANFPMVSYTIVGGGDWKPELEALSEKLGLVDKITFTGEINEEDLQKQYQTANLFVLPSDGEGFGIVFLEAWQHHLPVIASKYGAAPEVVRNGQDGYCVEPTPGEIAWAIIDLLSNRDKAQKMGESGYLRVKTHFTHEAFETRLTQILFDGLGS
jgi:glycosyltransferase involved in cell wall biosynthesis